MEIGQTTTETPASSTAENALQQTGLDQQAFLRLFMAQLENQDPLSPQDPTELASQLAQFSQFEQSLRMVDELQEIKSRLEELIEVNEAQSAPTVDPLALLGRQIEFEGDTVQVSANGIASALRFDLTQEGQEVGIVVRNEFGEPAARALLADTYLGAGTYELDLNGDTPSLRTPTGNVVPIDFERLASNSEGDLHVVLGADGSAEPFSFEPGHTYRFTVGATTMNGELIDLATTGTGTVEAVRNTSGTPVVVVHGQEMDLSKLIRIR
jgi:flagellar basal-body rod modification protein FlgD